MFTTKNSAKYLFAFLASMVLFSACQKENAEPWQGLRLPSNFPQPYYKMDKNPVTQAGFELGRKLFYDPILSRNNTISCGSCHNQGSAFTHHGHDVSHGIDDLLGRRNALPVQNLLWQSSFFWDGGVSHIDLISINPIENPVEMDESITQAIQKLKTSSTYPALFKRAFGTEEVTSQRFLQAMSQFMAMLISANSKYDQVMRKENGATFSAEELAGFSLFQEKCGSCHQGSLFSDFSFRNNGLSAEFSQDAGRYEISLLEEDKGKFKVPSLRNIAKTAPYMHHGQIGTLEGVLDHYSSGVKQSTTLDPLLKKGIPMTATEKTQIIAFLKTLTDDDFIRNPMFAEH